jgi:hypothetical protein
MVEKHGSRAHDRIDDVRETPDVTIGSDPTRALDHDPAADPRAAADAHIRIQMSGVGIVDEDSARLEALAGSPTKELDSLAPIGGVADS